MNSILQLNSSYVLVLNKHYLPINVISTKEAIKKIFRGKVDVLEVNDSFSIKNFYVPSVIKLNYDVFINKQFRIFKPFNKRNVWLEYDKKCAYCGKSLSLNEVHLDHVIPKARKGIRNWDNIVCCCLACNGKKRSRTPEEAKMKLLVPIVKQKAVTISLEKRLYEFLNYLLRTTEVQENWKRYVMHILKEEDTNAIL